MFQHRRSIRVCRALLAAAAVAARILPTAAAECGDASPEDEPIIRQHLAKFDKLFPALALVFHVCSLSALFAWKNKPT
jgi:hypothetical protein